MKKLNIFILLFIVLTQVIIAQDKASEIRAKLFDKNLEEVLVVAHRGDWRNAPENSLPAIEMAIEMGVDIIELDIQATKDGELILMHDRTIDRTTTGKGKVSEWTLDSIKTLNLRNGCAIKTREKVPTLEEALLLVKGKVLVNLDKADSHFDKVYALLEKTGTTDQIIMKGGKSAEDVKKLYGEYLQHVIYMPIVSLEKKDAEVQINKFIEDMSPVAFELTYRSKDNPLPAKLSESLKGKTLIWYNTLWDTLAGGHDDDTALDDPEFAYGQLIKEYGARIIQTDRPAYLIEYLKKEGLRK